mgnify:FL=1
MDRIRDMFDPGPILRRDRPLWAAAHTIDDLADLTARWLAGDIASQPSYYGPVDVDEDDAAGLTETLIALNRAGYLTNNSQAGCDVIGARGWQWEQSAAVTGFAGDDTYRWLCNVIAGTRFEILAGRCQRRGPRVTVTFTDGRPYTEFGVDGPGDVRFLYGGCDDAAVDALVAAWQVTVYDPEIGSNDLWAHLHDAAASR